MIISRTPYRISLFGGGSDHPVWFRNNSGSVLSFAIDKFCYITTRILPPFFEHRFRIAYSKVETVKNFDLIEHPVVRESIRKYAPELSLEIHHDGDLPARSGIGSSSAFAVGMVHSILALKGSCPSGFDLANEAIDLEHTILRENVGWQDQIACAVGGFNFINFGPGHQWEMTPLKLELDYVEEIESRMVLIYTGIQRISSDVTAGLLENLESKIEYMREIVRLAIEAKEVLEKRQNLDVIGEMLDYGWRLKKRVNPLSSNFDIDKLYEKGRMAGALGGKILGAGGGGFLLFWIKEGVRNSFLKELGLPTEIPVRISAVGSTIIYPTNVTASKMSK